MEFAFDLPLAFAGPEIDFIFQACRQYLRLTAAPVTPPAVVPVVNLSKGYLRQMLRRVAAPGDKDA